MMSIVVDTLFYKVVYDAGRQLCCQNNFSVFLRSYKYTFTKLVCFCKAQFVLIWFE